MTNPPDVENVLRASWDGQADPRAMFRALSQATLLLAVRPDADGSPTPYVFEFAGSPHGAVFTSAETTAMLPGAPDFMPILGRELGRRWPDGLLALLNPGSGPLARAFNDTAMRYLQHPDEVPKDEPDGTALAPRRVTPPTAPPADSGAVRSDREAVRGGQPFALGAPAQPPPAALVDAVRQAVRAAPAVDSVYLFQFVQPPGEPRLVAGVVVADPRLEETATIALADAVAARYPAAAQLDFLPLNNDMRAAVAEHVAPIG